MNIFEQGNLFFFLVGKYFEKKIFDENEMYEVFDGCVRLR